MILREPVSIMFGILTALILAFSGALGTSIYQGSMRDCERNNSQLQAEQREGPLQRCAL